MPALFWMGAAVPRYLGPKGFSELISQLLVQLFTSYSPVIQSTLLRPFELAHGGERGVTDASGALPRVDGVAD